MTMPKAVAFLILSVALMVAGVALVAVRLDRGTIDSSIGSRSSGARSGADPATPQGNGHISGGQAGATATAAWKTATAAIGRAGTATSAPPAPSTSAAVAVGASIVVNGSRYTVHQVADPEPPGIFTTNAGSRRVALEVSQQAVSGTVTYGFVDFRLVDSAGKEYTWAITNSQPTFGAGSLQAGETQRGWLSFQVAADATLEAVVLRIPGQARSTPLVTLR